MRRILKTGGIIIVLLTVLLVAAAAWNISGNRKKYDPKNIVINKSDAMKISSPAFENNGNIPEKYTCDGHSVNPPLEITDVPEGTESLAFIMHDPDAIISGGFVHWVLYNFSPDTKEIPENGKPTDATEGNSSSHETGYVGPCPPFGTHHYHFKVFALDTKLDLDSGETRDDLLKAMEGHIIDNAELVALYEKQ
ncbi:MAG: YbhB/YbcL family Raf kinase inhibitor-like protein [Parcubacteria group bacterium]|jgi:hypothetical protein